MDKTRQEAWELLCEFTQSESLRKHALTVEAVMRHFAHHHQADEEVWGMAGLLHDFDYERFPDVNEHAKVGGRVLQERGFEAGLHLAQKLLAEVARVEVVPRAQRRRQRVT